MEISHGLDSYYDHLRLTEEGNQENEKRGDYTGVVCFGFWLHQEGPEAGVICWMNEHVVLAKSVR